MIDLLETFWEAIAWPMEPIAPYGPFHILYTLLGFAVCGLSAWRLRRVSDRTAGMILFTLGLLLVTSEVFKQLFYFFVVEDNRYCWGEFPFQLCSIPMYL